MYYPLSYWNRGFKSQYFGAGGRILSLGVFQQQWYVAVTWIAGPHVKHDIWLVTFDHHQFGHEAVHDKARWKALSAV
jgi:hypothetical protein